MSSSNDIVKRALKRLGVLAPGEDMDAADAADGNAALNAMIASWQIDGVDVASDVPLPSRHEDGIVALLAVRIAPDYGKTPSAQVVADADKGWAGLLAEYIRAPRAQFDTALVNMPSQRYGYGIGAIPTWRPLYAYSLGDTAQYRGWVYECTTAGTSGATVGPTGRTTVLDGSVTWTFREVL